MEAQRSFSDGTFSRHRCLLKVRLGTLLIQSASRIQTTRFIIQIMYYYLCNTAYARQEGRGEGHHCGDRVQRMTLNMYLYF